MLNVPFLDLLKAQLYMYICMSSLNLKTLVLCPLFVKLIGIELFTADAQ